MSIQFWNLSVCLLTASLLIPVVQAETPGEPNDLGIPGVCFENLDGDGAIQCWGVVEGCDGGYRFNAGGVGHWDGGSDADGTASCVAWYYAHPDGWMGAACTDTHLTSGATCVGVRDSDPDLFLYGACVQNREGDGTTECWGVLTDCAGAPGLLSAGVGHGNETDMECVAWHTFNDGTVLAAACANTHLTSGTLCVGPRTGEGWAAAVCAEGEATDGRTCVGLR